MSPTPDITTVIVNWNTSDLLDDCLRSIRKFPATGRTNEVVVVDNASKDDSVEMLRRDWPEVRVIENTENVGFCRANNQAIRASESEYLLLINTDGFLTEGCLDTMLGYFERDPRAAVVGPRLEYGDGTFQRWTAGDELSLRSFANHYLALDKLSDRFPSLSSIYLAHDTDTPFQPGWVSSAVMALRRSALDEIGLLNEEIFVYMDDVDLCQRATDAGWNVWYAADATATHLCGSSTKRDTGKASPEAMRAINRWYGNRHGPAAEKAARALQAIGFGSRAGALGALGALRHDQEAQARAKAHYAYFKLSLEKPKDRTP